MNKEEVSMLIDDKLGPINDFIDMFRDIPAVSAEIYHNSKEIMKEIYQSEVRFHEIKDSQESLEKNLNTLKNLLK